MTIVGAGDVFSRYVGADIAAARSSSLRIANVLDVRPIEFDTVRSRYLDAGLTPPEFRRLESGTGDFLLACLSSLAISGPVVIATPTQAHLDYTVSCIESGYFVGLEKPYVGGLEEVKTFDRLVRTFGTRPLFLFGYYLLEKALPLLPLMRAGAVPDAYLEELSPSMSLSEWRQLRQRLGEVMEVAGCIFEGLGAKGGLAHRLWVLEPSSGGITFEQFYHLACLLALIAESETVVGEQWVEIEDVLLLNDTRIAAEAASRGIPRPAETLTFARLRLANGAPVVFGAGKYMPREAHERWLRIKFQGGVVFVDLERREMRVVAGDVKAKVGLQRSIAYGTQWSLFEKSLIYGQPEAEYALSYAALRLTARIRDLGLDRGIEAAVIRSQDAPLIHRIMSMPGAGPPLRALIPIRT